MDGRHGANGRPHGGDGNRGVSPAPLGRRRKVLVVSDDEGFIHGVRSGLHGAGCRTVVAPGVQAARRLAARRSIDVVVLDLDDDGASWRDRLAPLRALVGIERGAPVIAVSFRPAAEDAVAAMRAGATDYLIRGRGARLGRRILEAVVRQKDRSVRTRPFPSPLPRARDALSRHAELMRSALDHIGIGLAVFDDSLRLRVWNRLFLEINQYTLEVIRPGLRLDSLVRHNVRRGDYGPDADEEEMVRLRLTRAAQPLIRCYQRLCPDGRTVEVRCAPLPQGGYVATYADVTLRNKAERDAWRRANYDSLTGLANRDLLEDRLDQAVRKADRGGARPAVLFVDLDGFKEVNDTWGHDVGDVLLYQAGERMRDCVRSSDTVARFGGDEFAILLPDGGFSDDVLVVARKLLNGLSQPFEIKGVRASVTASLGIALFPRDGHVAEELLAAADSAMYEAKTAGKNRFHFHRTVDEPSFPVPTAGLGGTGERGG